jgi:hypothetical protein
MRTAKSCGPDASTLAFKSREGIREVTVTKTPDHRGEHEVSRKTIARGMPDASAEPVCSCVQPTSFCARDRGCSAHPAFPAPSVWRGTGSCITRALCVAIIHSSCPDLIRASINLQKNFLRGWIAGSSPAMTNSAKPRRTGYREVCITTWLSIFLHKDDVDLYR